MKLVIAPDSFKGSLTSVEVADLVERGVLRACGDIEVSRVPMADGGEGTVAAMVNAAGGEIRYLDVTGPMGETVTAFYGVLKDNTTYIIEMAAASGLLLVPAEKRNPETAASFGTGQLIRNAVENGAKKLIIGIGGSATNDGGMGMAQAMGVRFLDQENRELGLGGQELEKIHGIDCGQLCRRIKEVEILVACDVTNPLCGPIGASHVFGPQKGATGEMVQRLDRGLENYALRIKELLGKDIKDIPGAGAAGGMGGGTIAFLNAVLKPGIQIISDITGLEKKIAEADLVITGEGNTDFQTAFGKVPVGVSRMAQKYKKPVICLSGGLGQGIDTLYAEGITSLFSIVNRPMSLADAMENASSLISDAAENLMRLYLSSDLYAFSDRKNFFTIGA